MKVELEINPAETNQDAAIDAALAEAHSAVYNLADTSETGIINEFIEKLTEFGITVSTEIGANPFSAGFDDYKAWADTNAFPSLDLTQAEKTHCFLDRVALLQSAIKIYIRKKFRLPFGIRTDSKSQAGVTQTIAYADMDKAWRALCIQYRGPAFI